MSEKEYLTGIREAMARQLASLNRHRDRYVKAWLATYGVHPADADLVEERGPDGTLTITIRARTLRRRSPTE